MSKFRAAFNPFRQKLIRHHARRSRMLRAPALPPLLEPAAGFEPFAGAFADCTIWFGDVPFAKADPVTLAETLGREAFLCLMPHFPVRIRRPFAHCSVCCSNVRQGRVGSVPGEGGRHGIEVAVPLLGLRDVLVAPICGEGVST